MLLETRDLIDAPLARSRNFVDVEGATPLAQKVERTAVRTGYGLAVLGLVFGQHVEGLRPYVVRPQFARNARLLVLTKFVFAALFVVEVDGFPVGGVPRCLRWYGQNLLHAPALCRHLIQF